MTKPRITDKLVLSLIIAFYCWISPSFSQTANRPAAGNAVMPSADAIPHTLSMSVFPESDTVRAGDSVVMFAIIKDDTGGIRTPEFDTSISWAIFPADNFCRVTPAEGSRVTFHGNVGYRTYNVIARFFDPGILTTPFFDTVKIYIKPGEPLQLLIEPYPVASQYAPDPVDSLVLLPTETQKEIAAVIRDRFGNFSRFDSSVTWESGDSGIVKASAPDKPYVCLVEKVRSGTTYVVCKSGGLTLGTVKVIVNPGTKVVSLEARSVLQKTTKAIEYFNLRGQKLPMYGIHHADGIVLERIIKPDGKANVRKIIPEIKSR